MIVIAVAFSVLSLFDMQSDQIVGMRAVDELEDNFADSQPTNALTLARHQTTGSPLMVLEPVAVRVHLTAYHGL